MSSIRLITHKSKTELNLFESNSLFIYNISSGKRNYRLLLPFIIPVDGLIEEMFEDPLYNEIIETKIFQRLFEIPFLGGLSYIKENNNVDTRGDHSIGVALLSYYFCKKANLRKNVERKYVSSALLHDIHHLPFSHTMEIALRTQLPEFSLYKETEKILYVQKDNKGRSISGILKKHGIDTSELSLFNQKELRPLLFGCTHNADTLEGITRSNIFFNQVENISENLPIKVLNVILSKRFNSRASLKDLSVLDEFWILKNKTYRDGIYEARRVLYERILAFYLFELCLTNELIENLVSYSDRDVFELFPDLKNKIKYLWHSINDSCSVSTLAQSERYQEYYTSPQESVNQKISKDILKLQIQSRQFKINVRELISSTNIPRGTDRYSVKPLITIVDVHNNIIKQAEKILEFDMLEDKFQYIAKEMDHFFLL
ncbi:MAG: HD domain-containing protein [Bacteroidota bacterium]